MTVTKSPSQLDEGINRIRIPALNTRPMALGEGGKKIFASGVAEIDFKVPQSSVRGN